jgi:hypothetical protein
MSLLDCTPITGLGDGLAPESLSGCLEDMISRLLMNSHNVTHWAILLSLTRQSQCVPFAGMMVGVIMSEHNNGEVWAAIRRPRDKRFDAFWAF